MCVLINSQDRSYNVIAQSLNAKGITMVCMFLMLKDAVAVWQLSSENRKNTEIGRNVTLNIGQFYSLNMYNT